MASFSICYQARVIWRRAFPGLHWLTERGVERPRVFVCTHIVDKTRMSCHWDMSILGTAEREQKRPVRALGFITNARDFHA